MHPPLTFIVTLLFSSAAFAQNTPKPTVSESPLTSEQTTIYRTVLADYLKGSSRVLNLANTTEPLLQSNAACEGNLGLAPTKESGSIVHRLEPSLVAQMRVALVDPGRQKTIIERNDPQNVVRKAVITGKHLDGEELERSIKNAFDHGLFTFSEIAFDVERRRALVSYSFRCGELCGHGQTLILKMIDGRWEIQTRCGGWVS